jgi:hypothetical protein
VTHGVIYFKNTNHFTQAPVEGELGDVVPPNVAVDRVVRVVLPAVADVPEPLLAPQTDLKCPFTM